MATTKNIDKSKSLKILPVSVGDLYYLCDICGSQDIVETREGFTCRACGIVLEVQKLEYHRPYDADVVQHAVLSKTLMGFKSERRNFPHSAKLEGLSRIDASRSTEESVVTRAKVEIKRILTALGFTLTDFKIILNKFKENRAKLGKGTKYRSPQMLVPCIIYAYYKENNKPISEKDLLDVSDISKKDFNAFKFSILSIWPEYKDRNRKEYIIQRILEVTEHFNLGMPFFYQSKKILNRFYESIKLTKDDVIIGLVASITLLCSQKGNVSISALCNRLGIKMSTIHRQVERRVIQRFNIPGFKSLVKSADLLKKVMGKLGVLNPGFVDLIEVSKNSLENEDIVQVILGNASQVFNSLNECDEHFLFVKEASGYIVASITNKQDSFNTNHKFNFKDFYVSDKKETYDNQKPVDVALWKYYNPKGPPVLC